MLFNHLILCQPLLFLPSIFPSIRDSSNESVLCIRWPKYWSFSFSISPSNECSGLISFRMDWLDLSAVPGTLKSLLQCVPMYMLECSLSGVGLFVTLWTVACQTSLFHEISQAITLERVAISSSRGSTWPRDWTHISCTDRWILYHWAIWEAHYVGIVQALFPLLLKRTLILIFSHFSPFTILLLRYKTQHFFPEAKKNKLKQHRGDFPGPVVKTSCSQ